MSKPRQGFAGGGLLLFSSFILPPSSFRLHPSSLFRLPPSAFFRLSSFILHPSSFILSALRPTLYDFLPRAGDVPTNDFLLGRFLEYVVETQLELYPAQEAAILELFEERNVILNTPTGSGKSLVAMALQFKALAQGKRSVYTCPIKALVNEKWLALCREFGADNVGLSTGDGTVNHDAPVLCCTAEILANMALSEGSRANVRDVIMDEFHYYSDRERGGAWQVPLLALPQARFSPDVRHAGRHRVLRGGTDRAQRETDRHRALDAAARAAGFPILGNAARADRGRSRHRRERAGVRGAFHAGGGGGKRAGFHQPERGDEGREGGDCHAVGGLPLRQPLRSGNQTLAATRDRVAPRGTAAQVPRAGRTTRATRIAQGHLRDGHAGGRHQRAHPHGALHAAVQVRRAENGDPQRARFPPDQRAGRAQRI